MKNTKLIVINLFLFVLLILSPLIVLLWVPLPPARDYWIEFSVALGYSGIAIMGFQLFLTARIKWINRLWGEYVVYQMHKSLSVIALIMIIAHPVILFIINPERIALLNIFTAPWRARFASISTYSLIALILLALLRNKLNIKYEIWHYTHLILAFLAIAGGLAHVFAWGYYLESPVKNGLWLILVMMWCVILLYTRVLRPIVSLKKPYKVTSKKNQRGDCTTLVMHPVNHSGFTFLPGQYGLLTAFRHPFSLTSHPFSFSSSADVDDGRIEMTIKQCGDFTKRIRDISPGDKVFIDGPHGGYQMTESTDVHVFIAGGIGITPIISIIRTLADRNDKRPVILFYGFRDWASCTFKEELISLANVINMKLVFIIEKLDEDGATEYGVINRVILERHLPQAPKDHKYFICGPDSMIPIVEKMLSAMSVPIENYHSEKYSFS